jgi:hypothetical protein
MEFSGLGGGVMLAVAAGLWLIYLLPNWFKRREYLATEMNAVRLQQTIRVLAETSEIPQVLRASTQRGVAVGRAVTAPPTVREDSRIVAARRLRRTRAFTSLLLLASLVVAGWQVTLMVGTGALLSSWLVLGGAVLAAYASLSMLGRMAHIASSRRDSVARPVRRTSLADDHELVEQQQVGWTPVPLPKPLYLSRVAAQAFPIEDPALEMQLAAASAERALRSVEQPPAIVTVAANRFASMGIVGDSRSTVPDLDAVLARRRAAG